jgi:hypothetical protein
VAGRTADLGLDLGDAEAHREAHGRPGVRHPQVLDGDAHPLGDGARPHQK